MRRWFATSRTARTDSILSFCADCKASDWPRLATTWRVASLSSRLATPASAWMAILMVLSTG